MHAFTPKLHDFYRKKEKKIDSQTGFKQQLFINHFYMDFTSFNNSVLKKYSEIFSKFLNVQ